MKSDSVFNNPGLILIGPDGFAVTKMSFNLNPITIGDGIALSIYSRVEMMYEASADPSCLAFSLSSFITVHSFTRSLVHCC